MTLGRRGPQHGRTSTNRPVRACKFQDLICIQIRNLVSRQERQVSQVGLGAGQACQLDEVQGSVSCIKSFDEVQLGGELQCPSEGGQRPSEVMQVVGT